MQTFLPYPDFEESAKCLDLKRLGKQRVETLQLLQALHLGQGWIHHPAARMWRGFECALMAYQSAIVAQWVSNTTQKGKPYADTCLDSSWNLHEQFCPGPCTDARLVIPMPPWLGNAAFHEAHKSSLIRKKPEHYGLLWPTVSDNLEYIWPEETK